ncbi:MAG: T9SS type A sorting domain-containing protein [Hymenobacteraceae bacterium]|nr:T9SS type A sorting domain-containing protein [Hymenobacteraceae bacterium]
MIHSKDGNLFISGSNNPESWVYKVNLNGDSLAFKNFNLGIRQDVFIGRQRLLATNDGGLICIITSWSNSAGSNPDSAGIENVIKLDSALNTVWHYKHPVVSGRDFKLKAITELPDSSILVLSSDYGLSYLNNQFDLLHFSAQGQLLHTYPYTSSFSHQITLEKGLYLGDSSLYVIGNSTLSNTTLDTDSYVAKISFKNQAVGVADALSESVVAVYPNPASNTISINLPEHVQEAELLLFNSSGQQVLTRKLIATKAEADISHLPPGLYLYRIIAGKHVKTGKLVKE